MRPIPLASLHYTTVLAFCVCSGAARAAETAIPTPLSPPAIAVSQVQPMSGFEQMLVRVYQENPKLHAERRALAQEDEKVAQANGGFRPTVTLDMAGGRQRQKISGASWQYGEATRGALTVTQPLFSGFGTVEQKRAAERRVMAARARLLTVEQEIFFTAIRDWLELCEKEQVLLLTYAHRQRLARYGAMTRARFEAGDGTATEVAQAESRHALAEARYAQALAARDIAQASFLRDTGQSAPSVAFPPVPEGLPASVEQAVLAARDNPALLQARREEEAASHDIGKAESSLWPKVFLRGSMSEERASFIGLNRFRNDALTLNVSFPLYQGGAEYSRVREAKVARLRSHDLAEDVARDVVARAQHAWSNYLSAQAVFSASDTALAAVSRALAGVEEEQKQGLRTLTEMLDEQTEYFNAEVTHVQADKDVRLEAYRLLASTGKLTAAALNLPVEAYDPVQHYDAVRGLWAGLGPRQ